MLMRSKLSVLRRLLRAYRCVGAPVPDVFDDLLLLFLYGPSSDDQTGRSFSFQVGARGLIRTRDSDHHVLS